MPEGAEKARRMEVVAHWLLVGAVAELVPYLLAWFVSFAVSGPPRTAELFGQGQLYLSSIVMGVAAIVETTSKALERKERDGRQAKGRWLILSCYVGLAVVCLLAAGGYAGAVVQEARHQKPLPQAKASVVASDAERQAAALHSEEWRTARVSEYTFGSTFLPALVLVALV